MKLLIKFPTRGRTEKFFSVLDRYYALLNDLDNTEFCVTIDEDDISMNNDKTLDRLETYKNLYYYIGNSKSKIEAINADMEDFTDFDIVLLASDDMIPQKQGYDDIIRDNMKRYYSDTDGVLWFYDGNRKDLNTLCILGKKYYDRFGYIYHPGYKSFYCDDEFTQVANRLKKQQFINDIIVKHEHPDIPQFRDKMDQLYMVNSKYYPIDNNFFQLRKKNNFGLR
jgi:hypothetical protein